MSGVAQAGPGRQGGFVVLGGSPGVPAVNPKTDTLYVPIQCTNPATAASCAATASHVVDVINASTCNVKVTSGCRVVGRAKAGKSPQAATVDEQTDTLYVANGGGSISVVNGARCNASVTSGCAAPLATIRTGGFPVASAINAATHTLYVASPDGQVFVIGIARCSAVTTAGCRRPVKTIKDSLDPAAIAVNAKTDTVYAANAGPTGNGDTVSVINGATCNGSTGSGCSQSPPTVTVGSGAAWDVVDQATDTIYTASYNTGTVSVINGAACNAKVTSGCGRTPPAVPTGAGAGYVEADQALHTVFTVNQQDDTLSAINTRTCDGTVTSGCAARPPNQQATFLQGPGYNSFPGAVALGPQASGYVVTVGGRNLLSVLNISRCNATNTTGCRAEAPAVPEGEFLLSADPATDTLYGGDLSQPVIDVTSGATCHARDLSHCAPVAQIPVADPGANVGAIDQATHTLYVADPPSAKVFMVNTAACNATHTSGCAARPPTAKIGPDPQVPAVNPATQTMYVSYGAQGQANRIAVINAATCNATDTTGCSRPPAVIKVETGTSILAVSPSTDTIYAPASGPGFSGDTVAVINGATCNGTDHAGCGHLAATAKVGTGPFGVAVNDRTHTVYVANNADGDSPGTVSVINAAACNGTHTTGCHRHFPTAATGNSPLLIAADTSTNTLYVSDFSSASVTILNGAQCDAEVTSGCGKATTEQAVGSGPFGLAVNPRTRTVYAANIYSPGSLSIFRIR